MPTHTGVLLFWSRRVRVASAVGAVAALVLLGGDVASTAARCPGQCQVASAALSVSAPQPPAPKPAALRIWPRPSSEDVNPAAAVSVAAFSGTLDDVTMVNDADKPIPGVLTRDKRGWHPTSQLGYGRTYTMTITARGPGGMPSRQTSSFTTLSPDYQAAVYLNTTAGAPIQDGGTYGVGTVVVARFDSAIDDRGRRREAPARHHQPARCRILELGRRPDRPLATGEVLRARALPSTSPPRSTARGWATASMATRTNMFRSRSETRTSPSPTTRRSKSACSTTASSSGPCRPPWAWAAHRRSAARPCRSGRRRASTP